MILQTRPKKMSKGLDISESHPLSSELSSLRHAVTRFQDEAYNSSIKLQKHSLRATNAHDRLTFLERENAVLRSELSLLRAHPHPDASPRAHPAALQVQQLSLSLRRLSDKLSLTEEALLERTTQLAYATAETSKAKLASENAYELASRTRGREEAGKLRELEMEWKVRAAEEAAKMSDRVVAEYADLVRTLEVKSGARSSLTSNSAQSSHESESQSSSSTLRDGLLEGKLGLQRLLSEFSAAVEKSQKEALENQGELAELKAKQSAEDKCLELSRSELAQSQAELERLRIEDNTATKMVSRYMKFSQKSTDTLQTALEALKARHTATIDTISAQMSHLSEQLQLSEQQTEKLRHALNELGSETLKEAYGRRREIALRIRLINREEKLREGMERWLRRVGETMTREDIESQALRDMIREARTLLSGNFDGLTDSSSGALARLIMAESAVEMLKTELEAEMSRRLELESVIYQYDPGASVDEPANKHLAEGPTVPMINSVAEAVIPFPTEQPSTTAPSSSLGISGNRMSPPIDQPSSPVQIDEIAGSEQAPINDAIPVGTADSEQYDPPIDLLLDCSDHQDPSPSPETPRVPPESLSSIVGDPRTQVPQLVASILPPTDAAVVLVNGPDPDPPQIGYVVDEIEPPVAAMAQEDDAPHIVGDPRTQVPQLVVRLLPPTDAAVAIVNGPDPDHTQTGYTLDKIESPFATMAQEDDAPHQDDNLGAHYFKEPSPELPQSPKFPTPIPSPQLSSPHFISIPPKPAIEPLPPHPLLSELPKAKQRYDSLQRSFRDCHLALEALSNDLASVLDTARSVPPEVIRTALQRLTDYTEDARVEVEIRIADEALIARGYETLLSIPGALSPADAAGLENGHDSLSYSDIEQQVKEFISGNEPSIGKAYRSLSRKLEDVQHDIAALKRAVHEEVGSLTPHTGTGPALNGGSPQAGGWSSWVLNSPSLATDSLPTGARSASGPPPTFGSVMTTPRLRHSPSLNFEPSSSSLSSSPLSPLGRRRMPSELAISARDPFTRLGLKVPMPNYYVPRAGGGGGGGGGTAASQQPQPRSRTLSTMYMLGFGARKLSGALASTSSLNAKRDELLLDARAETERGDNFDVE